jgi:hypothetical protein
MTSEPAMAPAGEAVPENEPITARQVLNLYDGDALAAIDAMMADIDYLREELTVASLAMSFGFARGWQPATRQRR